MKLFSRKGTAGFYYHQLVKGKVKWYNIDEQGKEFLQCIICEGESFGELPLLDDGPYVSSAAAIEDCILLKLRKIVSCKCSGKIRSYISALQD